MCNEALQEPDVYKGSDTTQHVRRERWPDVRGICDTCSGLVQAIGSHGVEMYWHHTGIGRRTADANHTATVRNVRYDRPLRD